MRNECKEHLGEWDRHYSYFVPFRGWRRSNGRVPILA
jgi:hypothetical protein